MCIKIFRLIGAVSLLAFSSGLYAQTTNPGNCGYSLNSGLQATMPNPASYHGRSEVVNQTGEVATSFKILLDIGNSNIRDVQQADYSPAEGAYFVSSPASMQHKGIPKGGEYRFKYTATGTYTAPTGYIILING
ncbi:MAG: hypothetical protein V4660_16665, partial [Pseudomonadota bacterium]